MSDEVNVRLTGFRRIDFDKKVIGKALRIEGSQLSKVAKKLVSRKGGSAADEHPAKRRGALRRAIRSKLSKSGTAVFVQPEKTPDMGKDFYPAFLVHGVRAGRRKPPADGKKSSSKASGGWSLARRADYMKTALALRGKAATEAIRNALESAMVPRK